MSASFQKKSFQSILGLWIQSLSRHLSIDSGLELGSFNNNNPLITKESALSTLTLPTVASFNCVNLAGKKFI
jgi:hypothetical protein